MVWKLRLFAALGVSLGAALAVAGMPASAASIAETVIVGAEDAWYPYSGLVKGELQGMTVDIVRAAYRAVGVEVKFDPMPYARCVALTRSGAQLACFDTFRTPDTESDFLWHSPSLFRVEYLIYAPADSKKKHLGVRDLEGQQVALTRGYEYGAEFDRDSKIRRELSSSDESNFRMLLAGRVAYTVTAKIIADQLFMAHPELARKFRIVGSVSRNDVYMAFSRQHPDGPREMARFEKGLRLIRENGRLEAIERRWLGRAE